MPSPLDYLYPGINPLEEDQGQISPEVLQALALQGAPNASVPPASETQPVDPTALSQSLLGITGVPTGNVPVQALPGAVSAPQIGFSSSPVPPPTPGAENGLQAQITPVEGGLDAVSGGEYFPISESPGSPTSVQGQETVEQTQGPNPEELYASGLEESRGVVGSVDETGTKARSLLEEATELTDIGESRALFDQTRNLAEAHYAAVKQERQDLLTRNVDPGRWWHNRSVPQKIMSVIGLFLSGLTMPRTGRNIAMEIINNEIDKDVQAQTADLQKRQGLLSEMSATGERQIGQARQYAVDVLSAKQNRVEALYREVDGLLKNTQLSAQYRDRLANLQIDLGKARDELELRQKALYYELYDKQVKNQIAMAKATAKGKGGTGGGKPVSSSPILSGNKSIGIVDAREGNSDSLAARGGKWTQEDRERSIPGLNILDRNGKLVGDTFLAAKKLDPADEKILRNSKDAVQSLLALKEFIKLNPGIKHIYFLRNDSKKQAVWNSLFEQAKISVARALDLGALAKEDLSVVNGIIVGATDPTSAFRDILGAGGERAIDSAVTKELIKWEGLLEGYGFKSGENSIAPPSIPEKYKGALYGEKAKATRQTDEEVRKDLSAAEDQLSETKSFDELASRVFTPKGISKNPENIKAIQDFAADASNDSTNRQRASALLFLTSPTGRQWYSVNYTMKDKKPPKKFRGIINTVRGSKEFKSWLENENYNDPSALVTRRKVL